MNTIEWSAKAMRQLRKIADKRKRQDIYSETQQLADWPDCPGDIKRLQGRDDHRLRIGDHRVMFVIDQSGTPIIVTITQMGISKNSVFAQMQGAEKIS